MDDDDKSAVATQNILLRTPAVLQATTAKFGMHAANMIFNIRGLTVKFANLMLEGLFIMKLYQLDKQSTKFTIWKY